MTLFQSIKMTVFKSINENFSYGCNDYQTYGDIEISGNRLDISIHGTKTGELAIDINDRIAKAHTGKCFYDEHDDQEAIEFLTFFLELDEEVSK